MVFEDSPNGVKAAKAAGMVCVMVPDPRTSPELCTEADEVVLSLVDVNLQKYGLPPIQWNASIVCLKIQNTCNIN